MTDAMPRPNPLMWVFLIAGFLAIGGCAAVLSGDDGPYYPDCDSAVAAGVAPLRAGEPGFRAALDANNNGIACE